MMFKHDRDFHERFNPPPPRAALPVLKAVSRQAFFAFAAPRFAEGFHEQVYGVEPYVGEEPRLECLPVLQRQAAPVRRRGDVE